MQNLETALQLILKKKYSLDLEKDHKKIANYVLRMSDYYIAYPESKTPWQESWCQVAQLCYYLPLNFLRLERVVLEAQRLHFFSGITQVIDFGSGLGPSTMALKKHLKQELIIENQELSAVARNLALQLQEHMPNSTNSVNTTQDKKTLLICSYSLTELLQHERHKLFEYDNLLLVEPSTRQDSRLLMQLRQDLIDAKYSIWAPCTHQKLCPLLTQSQQDWCHDRLALDRPEWLQKIEQHLPFQNRTITFSYLLVRKTPKPLRSSSEVRIVGDLLKEKGKARQLICRGPEREYFAWMSRDGEPQEIPRGSLCLEPTDFELKSNELRIKTPISIVSG